MLSTFRVVRAGVVCLVVASSALAQAPQPAASAAVPQAPQPPAAGAPQQPVTEFALVRNARSHSPTPTAGLGDRMTVEVDNFAKLLESAGGNCAGIVLFLDTLPMNLTPESCNTQDGTVRYLLQRNSKNDD